MTTRKHKEYTYWILDQVRSINPYKRSYNDQRGNIYAYGFLASYLANILAEDPIMLRQFKKHIEQQQRQQRYK